MKLEIKQEAQIKFNDLMRRERNFPYVQLAGNHKKNEN